MTFLLIIEIIEIIKCELIWINMDPTKVTYELTDRQNTEREVDTDNDHIPQLGLASAPVCTVECTKLGMVQSFICTC